MADDRAHAVRAAATSFLIAAAALFAQVLVHRLISAKLLNNYAFLVISLTMLGFAVAGVVLTRALPALLARRDEYLGAFGAAFALTLLASSMIFSYLPAGLQFAGTTASFVVTLLTWLPAALLFAVPFGFAGLILGALLSDTRLPARMVYGADLLGSALGALIVIPAIRHLGVEKSLALCAAVTLAGLLAVTRPRRMAARALAAAAVLAIAFSMARPDLAFPIKVRSGSMLAATGETESYGMEYAQWDPVARIEISRVQSPRPDRSLHPLLTGDRAPFLARFRRMLTQNDYAYSYMVEYDGRRESLDGIQDTIYAAAYQATTVPRPQVVTIGVGGGFDILTALFFDASRAIGVEVNGATLDILRRVYAEYFRPWVTDPRVTLVEDDGRHFLAAAPASRYDVIQLSGVDSYSGTPGAAHVFSESYLYTAEAFDLYFSRLSDEGIVNVMRLEYQPPREMLRALVTAVAALRRAGVSDPGRHVITVAASGENFTALLVKKTPFTREQEDKLRAWAASLGTFYVSASPSDNAQRKNLSQLFLSLGDARREEAFVRAYPFDISPSTDDRPFFFNYSYWSDLISHPGRWPLMQTTVLLLIALVGVAAVVCVYLPLRYLAPADRPAASWRATLYFAAIAVGFMAVEIALLQKFGVFLGHPNYALSVVLAALLLSTGIGALVSSALVRALGRLRFVSYALAIVLLVAHFFVFPHLMAWVALPFTVRAALVFALVTPVGMLLGIFMPWGLDRLKETSPTLAPWAWGINGIFSVLAPVLSVAFAMTWGSGALMLTAIPAYLAAAACLDRDPAPRPA